MMAQNIFDQTWVQFGAVGMLIGFLFLFLCKFWDRLDTLQKSHEEERKVWIESIQKMSDKILNVVMENTQAISELSTLIKESTHDSSRKNRSADNN